METKQITAEMKAKLDAPLPPEAVKPHPSKSYLSTINAIYVTERLNDVFGVGSWRTKTEFVTSQPTGKTTMVVTKTIFEIPEYGIYYECYGGNDNADLGDAYKGSMTDALTKIGSYLGIGADVWKDKSNKQQTTQQRQQPAPAPQPKPQPQSQPTPASPKRKAAVTDYLQKLDDITLAQFQSTYKFTSIADLTDQQFNDIADYLNKQIKK